MWILIEYSPFIIYINNMMLKKLKSVSRSLALQSINKPFLGAVIFGLLLLWINKNYSFFPVIIYLGFAVYFYFYPAFENRFLSSFLIILSAPFFIIHSPIFPVYLLFFSFLFFLFLGIKNLVFANRYQVYQFLNNFLFFLIFIIFFSSDKSQLFFLKYLILFSSSFFIFKELLNWHFSRFESQLQISIQRINAYSAVFSFLLGQLVLATALLPIGFLNLSALMLVFVLTSKDLIINHLEGKIDKNSVLKNITIIILFSIVIFAVSKWKI